MIVTDHHRPGETLPNCPIVATRPSDYPFPDLCGTGVVVKLAQALLGADHPAVARHADLVALATIADVVPLVDENRALATIGLRGLSRTQKPGLRALMRVAGVDPATVDATAVGFRLAPRLNAAGRLGRPDVALHLVLTRRRARGRPARERARDAQPRPPGGRGQDPARGRRGRRRLAGGEAQPSRLRRLGRGLARGRDRHRRLAARRAVRPARRADRRRRRPLEGLRPLGAELRPPRRPRGLRRPPRAVRRPPGRRRPHDPRRSARAVRRGVRRARRRGARRRGPGARHPDRRDRARRLRSRSSSPASSSSWRRSASGTPT